MVSGQKYAWVQALMMNGFLVGSTSWLGMDWANGENGVATYIRLAIIHTQFKENDTGRVFDFQ